MSKKRKINLKERKCLWGGGMITDFDHFIICNPLCVSVRENLILCIKK